MSQKKSSHCSVYNVISYSYPKLHKGKTWYVDFLSYDPVEQKMRRKKYHLDGIKSLRERQARAAELIANITQRLREGWCPWVDAETKRQYTQMAQIFSIYSDYIAKLLRIGSIKRNTWLSWKSYMVVFSEWAEGSTAHLVYAYQLDKAMVNEFLEYMLLDRDVSAKTRNNYRAWLFMFCEWMLGKGYLAANPVEGIKKMTEDTKKRDALPPRELERLKTYLEQHDRHFLLACMMEYYCFIRPEELSCIKIGDISIKAQQVRVSAEVAKNRREGLVGLNDAVIRLMIDLDVFSHTSEEYLFGTRRFTPAQSKQSGRIFREEFIKVRKVLGWPDSYQFYSLKDTGIRDLANAEGIVVARDQARHSDISTTNKYLKGLSLTVHEETKHFDGGL